MPVVSKAQNAAMHSAAAGKSTLGIPKSVGQEFIADQKPGSVKKLPQRVKKPTRSKRNGQISERAAARMKSKDYGGKDGNNIPGATA